MIKIKAAQPTDRYQDQMPFYSTPLDNLKRKIFPIESAWDCFNRWCAYAVIVFVVFVALYDLRNFGNAAAGLGGSLLLVLPLLALYLLPAIIAERRHHRNRKAIAVLNVLLGWTFLGWVIALVWSYTADTE